VAGFGYLSAEDDPASWSADAILARPAQLLLALDLPEAVGS